MVETLTLPEGLTLESFKVTGVGSLSATTRGPIERAATEVARITEQLLAEMPERRVPPQTVPPLRRPEVRARLGLD